MSVRLRRLTADYEMIKQYSLLHPRIKLLQVDGDPPEKYQLEYLVKSIRMVNDEIKRIKTHVVEINLPRNYPRVAPQCRMLTPVFHPNIAPHAICVGDHWSAGESLKSIVMRIGEMLAYQSHNVKSPLNGEAAKWVEENRMSLPLDAVSFLLDEVDVPPAPIAPSAAVAPPSNKKPVPAAPVAESASVPKPEPEPDTYRLAEPQPPSTINAFCSNCGSTYKVPADKRGKKARCKSCRQVFVI